MSIINNGLLLASEAAAAGGYQVSRSLRFNSSDSAYLSRTPASAGNRKTWTWAGWVKRSRLGANEALFAVFSSADSFSQIGFTSGDALEVINYQSGNAARKNTTQVFRDCSAWSHILVAATSSTLSVYFNGSEITAFSINVAPNGADWLFNSTSLHSIGGRSGNNDQYSSLYLADIHFIDGQALTPSSFTEVSATTGQLIPKAYTGSYGTNGFRLPFSDNSGTTSTTLGKDSAGSNNWTPNNFSVAAGAGNDSLVDTPTSYGTDAQNGGEVRGNYCTLNPLDQRSATLTNGNLDVSIAASSSGVNPYASGTFAFTTGKWYFEATYTSSTSNAAFVAVTRASDFYTYISNTGVGYYGYDGSKVIDGTYTSYGSSFTTNDVIGVALNLDAGTVTFYKNNVSQGAITLPSSTSGWKPHLGQGTSSGAQGFTVNFGQRPFAYTAPSGFKALCDTNLPAPVVAKPNTVMDVKLYTGNGSTQAISGLGFSPDLVWIKGRSVATNNALYDFVRGANKRLMSNATDAEISATQDLTAFNSDGFTLGTDGTVNGNSNTYVGWCFDAGSSNTTNTAGSITSTVRVNATAGFSIVTYTGNSNSSKTIGHGLNSVPSLMIVKCRTAADNWVVYHKDLGNTSTLQLQSTNAIQTSDTTAFASTTPTSTVFTVGNSGRTGDAGRDYVAYLFSPVAGYSSFGSYTGNGSSDGPFVYTGFRPRWLMIKVTNISGESWVMKDAIRGAYNPNDPNLYADLSAAEQTGNSPRYIDFTSNGFKLRGTEVSVNGSGNTYVYMCFAESPFQFSRAR